MGLVCSFQTELWVVEQQMSKEICFKSTSMEDLIDLQMNKLDRQLCPSIVLALSKIAGQTEKKHLNLASIFQYIFLAHYIHKLVTDEHMTEHARQYPVLIGDFMFGQTFLKLCNKDLFPYSGEFVKIIELMNEGVILRWKSKNKNIALKDYRMIIYKERASLTGLAGRLGAEIAGLEKPYNRKLEEFGYSIGMAWAAWEESIYTPLVQEYLSKAKNIISELRDYLPIKPLQEVYELFYQAISHNKALANIK